MKKIISAILVAIFCAVTTLTFLPNVALADGGSTFELFTMDEKENVDKSHFEIANSAGFQYALEKIPKIKGHTYVYVSLNGLEKRIPTAIIIPDDDVTVIFQNGVIDCQGKCRAFNLKGDNIKLILDNVTIKNGISTGNDDTSEAGGAILVDGAHSSVIGRNEALITNCSASEYGGGIELDGHYCTVDNILFNQCTAKLGGAVLAWWSFSKIKNCGFRMNCTASDAGNYVYGNHRSEPTCIINCYRLSSGTVGSLKWKATNEDNDFAGNFKLYDNESDWEKDYSSYKSEFTGSMISQGNIWIIIVVAAVVILAVVALIILKKKGIIKTKKNA